MTSPADRTPRDNEAMRMALAVLAQWSSHPDASTRSLINSYRSERPDAVEMIPGGLIPIAGNLLLAAAKAKNVDPQDILKAFGEHLGGLD
jgi:hypothetical protein